jgi:hypothetical protein
VFNHEAVYKGMNVIGDILDRLSLDRSKFESVLSDVPCWFFLVVFLLW